MSERTGSSAATPGPTDHESGDTLAELEAEIAQELAEERPPAGGPGYQVAGAVVSILIGVGGLVLSRGYGLGSPRDPGPGLWPFAISLLITVLGVVLLLVGRGLEDSEVFSRSSVLPAIGLLTFVAVAVLLPVIGFEIPSLLLCLVWLRWLGGESWRTSIVVSVVTVAVFYVLFLYLLRIPLPHLIQI